LIDNFIETGSVEFVNALARPLPGRITLRLVGFDEREWSDFHRAVHSIIGESGFGAKGADEIRAAALAGRKWQRDRIEDLIRERRAKPADDLTSMLIEAEIDGTNLSDDDLADTINLLLDGGLDTTASSITFALLHMSRNPDIKRNLVADPGLMTSAVEEFLRLDAPVQGLARTVSHDCEFAGQAMSMGDRMLLLWASANRDAAIFEGPDKLDIGRPNNRHVTFGIGNHKCIGAHLGRLMLRVALEQVLARLPDFEIDEQTVERAPDVGTIYSFHRAQATFTPGPRSTEV
jgi:cytochrome P450